MIVRKKEGSLTKEEQQVIKALLTKGWRNQDIQALLNIGRKATVNSARITEVKSDDKIKAASDEAVEFFRKKREAYDPRTGLNLYEDERLIRARESMILAVQVFNSPNLHFKTEVFSVLANIAWTYLLHEYYDRKGVAVVGKDGRSLLLSQMIERHDCPLSKGMINNLKDLIDIRNDVEHKLLMRADKKFFPKFQACCLNFDKALCEIFDARLSLQHELSLALQFAKLDFEQITTLQKYDVPDHISALDARLDARLSDEERADIEYQFKVIYTLDNSAKSGAHIQFVKPGSAEGKEIHNILEKRVLADDDYPFKPAQVWATVARESKVTFSRNDHTKALRLYKARPTQKSSQPQNTDKKYCIYHKAHKDYTYSQAWVDFLVTQVKNPDELAKIRAVKVWNKK